MNHTEWVEEWQRIKGRFPSWTPTQVEAEDWCKALRFYDQEVVEKAGLLVVKKYSSNVPRLAWYMKFCEEEKKERRKYLSSVSEAKSPTSAELAQEQEKQKEEDISRLEAVSNDELMKAYIAVMKKYGHLISEPKSSNPREWKQTFRGLVYMHIFGDDNAIQ